MREGELIRIWSIFTLYEPNFAGGAVQGRLILKRMAPHGFEIRILTAAVYLAKSLQGKTVCKDGLTIKYLPVIARKDWIFLHPKALQKLFRYINVLLSDLSFSLMVGWTLYREGRPGDIVHFHSINWFSSLPEWVAKMRRMYTVVLLTLMGSDDPFSIKQSRDPLKSLKLGMFNQVDAIISLTSAQTESCRLAEVTLEKVYQIPCAVNTLKFSPLDSESKRVLREKLGLKQNHKHILFAGATLQRKGIDVLIEAFTDVARQRSDVDLILVGTSDFRDHQRNPPDRQILVQNLRDDLALKGLTERVHWIGKVDDPLPYFQVSDLFCFPSRREGFGIVIAEAMAAGLPMVVARLEGVTTDLVALPEEGMLIANHDPKHYAEALSQLLEDSDEAVRMGQAARKRAIRNFDLEVVAEQFAKLYRGLRKGKHN